MHLLLTSSRRLCLEGIAPLETLSALFVSSSFSLLIPVLPSSILPCLSSRSFSPPQLKAEAEPPLYRSLPPPPLPVIMPVTKGNRLILVSLVPLASRLVFLLSTTFLPSYRFFLAFLSNSVANEQKRVEGCRLESTERGYRSHIAYKVSPNIV